MNTTVIQCVKFANALYNGNEFSVQILGRTRKKIIIICKNIPTPQKSCYGCLG